MELLVAIIILVSMICIIVESYNIQKEKHRRNKEWMKQQLKNRRDDD